MLFRTLARALSEDNGLGGAVVTHESVVATALERFLVQLLMICLLCEVMGRLLAYVGQPRVIAEILAGIFLGPTVLGQAPGFELFSEGVETLTLVGELGLLLFLFLMGLELDLGLVKSQFRRSAAISLGGETLAFLLSYPTAMILHSGVPGLSETSLSELFLFIGVANSVTAFPVLSRIMNENNLLGTKVGTTVIASAAVDDIVAWTLLALVVSITSGGSKEESDAGSNADAAYILMMVIGFAIFMFVAVRPVLRLAIHRLDGKPSESEAQPPCQRTVALCLMLTIAASWTTAVLGSSAIFGAFITGLVLPRDNPHLAIGLMEKLEDLISVLLLPVFFAVSGLSTDFTQLNTAKAWGYAFMVLAVACAGKIVGCGSVARIQGFSKRESLAVGFLMNTRGLVEIVILNIGREAGILNEQAFAIMIFMAVGTTFLTSPATRLLLGKEEDREIADIAGKTLGSSSETALVGVATALVGSAPINLPSLQVEACLWDSASLRSFSQLVPLLLSPSAGTSKNVLHISRVMLTMDDGRLSTDLRAFSGVNGTLMRWDEMTPLENLVGSLGSELRGHMLLTQSGTGASAGAALLSKASSRSSDIVILPWRPRCRMGGLISATMALEEGDGLDRAVLLDRGLGGAIAAALHIYVPLLPGPSHAAALSFALLLVLNAGPASGCRLNIVVPATPASSPTKAASPTTDSDDSTSPSAARAAAAGTITSLQANRGRRPSLGASELLASFQQSGASERSAAEQEHAALLQAAEGMGAAIVRAPIPAGVQPTTEVLTGAVIRACQKGHEAGAGLFVCAFTQPTSVFPSEETGALGELGAALAAGSPTVSVISVKAAAVQPRDFAEV